MAHPLVADFSPQARKARSTEAAHFGLIAFGPPSPESYGPGGLVRRQRSRMPHAYPEHLPLFLRECVKPVGLRYAHGCHEA